MTSKRNERIFRTFLQPKAATNVWVKKTGMNTNKEKDIGENCIKREFVWVIKIKYSSSSNGEENACEMNTLKCIRMTYVFGGERLHRK